MENEARVWDVLCAGCQVKQISEAPENVALAGEQVVQEDEEGAEHLV